MGTRRIWPTVGLVGEHRRDRLDPEVDRLAEELQPGVLLQRAREEPGLAEHLEAVADADDRAAGAGVLGHRIHHRREPGDRPGPQVVAVGEPAGDHHRVDTVHRGVGVEQQLGVAAELLDHPHARRARSWCPGTAPPRPERSRHLRQGDGEGFDDGVGEEPVAHLVDLRARAAASDSASTTRRMLLPTFTWVTLV